MPRTVAAGVELLSRSFLEQGRLYPDVRHVLVAPRGVDPGDPEAASRGIVADLNLPGAPTVSRGSSGLFGETCFYVFYGADHAAGVAVLKALVSLTLAFTGYGRPEGLDTLDGAAGRLRDSDAALRDWADLIHMLSMGRSTDEPMNASLDQWADGRFVSRLSPGFFDASAHAVDVVCGPGDAPAAAERSDRDRFCYRLGCDGVAWGEVARLATAARAGGRWARLRRLSGPQAAQQAAARHAATEGSMPVRRKRRGQY